MEYLVLGLPRSRTSWLSVALNVNSNVPCLHEYISSGGDSKDINGLGCCEINPYIDYPECKTVVILRDSDDVSESLSYFSTKYDLQEGFLDKECLLARNKLISVAEERQALVIEFNDINSRLDEILDYLSIERTPFHDILMSYRIEPVIQDLDRILDHENFLCR